MLITTTLSKLVSTKFYQIFIFTLNDSPSKTIKNVFLFHQKSSFHSQDIKFLYFFPSFLHFPDSKGQMEVG